MVETVAKDIQNGGSPGKLKGRVCTQSDAQCLTVEGAAEAAHLSGDRKG